MEATRGARDWHGRDEAGLRADREQIVGAGDVAAQQAFMHPNYILNGNEVMRKAQVVEMLGHGRDGPDRLRTPRACRSPATSASSWAGKPWWRPAARLHGEGVFTNVPVRLTTDRRQALTLKHQPLFRTLIFGLYLQRE
jgi:hypothetical protein